jgi:hypothetical protein
MALVLLCLILGLVLDKRIFFQIALIVLVIDFILPKAFIPLAYLWFGLAQMVGAVMSKILLLIIYFVFVFPLGFIRRKAGKDPLQLKKWKQGRDSVFRTRNHQFIHSDIDKPY